MLYNNIKLGDNMENIVASFEYNDKRYVYMLNDNKITFGCKPDLEIDKNITKEENWMMRYVLSKIIISNDKKNINVEKLCIMGKNSKLCMMKFQKENFFIR